MMNCSCETGVSQLDTKLFYHSFIGPFLSLSLHLIMFRPVARSALTAGIGRSATRSQRFLSTAPPHEKSRSWKNSAARWTVAGAVVYYYNTHNVFAEDQNPSSCLINVLAARNGN